MSKNRILASLISNDTSKVKSVYTDSDSIVTSASLGVTAAAGTTTYSSADTLPASADDGDQALVTSTNRLYIYSGSGWYNIALINTTPYFTTSPSSTYDLSTTGAQTNIELLAVDSEGINITYSAITDSDFDAFATITKDSDNGRRFTVTLDSDASTTTSGTVTFRASDGVNIATALSTFSVAFTISNSNYTTILIKADSDGTDNQVDASPFARSITEGGNLTSTSFSPYHPGGYSVKFDGTDDYITVTDSTDFDFGDSDFTMEGWYYFEGDTSSGDYYILNFTSSAGNGHFGVNIYNGGWRVGLFNGSLITGTTGIDTNTWHHFAWVRKNGNMKFFVDGVSAGSDVSYSSALDCSGTFRIGTYATTPTYGEWNGRLRDIRIIKGTALYDSDMTVPTEALTAVSSTVLLTCHLPYFADGSTSGHTLTINNNPAIRRFSPYDSFIYTKTEYGGSIYNDGSGDYMTTPADTTNLTMSGDFTIDFWYYPTAAKSNGYVYGKWNNNSDGWAIFVTPNWSSGNFGYVTFYYGNYGSNESATNLRSSPITLNAWHYIRIVRSSNVFYMSVNGKYGTRSNYGSNGLSWSDTRTFNANAVMGITGQASGYSLGQAFMSDLRVLNGTALTTSDFTPPTSIASAPDSDTVLLTCTNKNSVFDAVGNQRVFTFGGNATASADQSKFAGESSFYFDGSGDYISVTDGLWKTFGSDDFTIEGWFRADALSGTRYILGDAASNGQTSTSSISICTVGTNLTVYGWVGSLLTITGSTTLSAETWYHFALTRSGSSWTLWLNGSSDATATRSGSVNDSSVAFALGRTGEYNGLYFAGYIQDVRYTKGLARYTSTFTPPTSTFKG